MNAQALPELSYNPIPKVAFRKSPLVKKLRDKKEEIAVVGLGYVGLPLAIHMAEKFRVMGYDLNQQKVKSLIRHIDPCEELKPEDFENKDVHFSFDEGDIQAAKFYIVAVPTPIAPSVIANNLSNDSSSQESDKSPSASSSCK